MKRRTLLQAGERELVLKNGRRLRSITAAAVDRNP